MSEDSAEVAPYAMAGHSVVTYRIGGHEYPMKSEPKCLVCRSNYRFDIEKQLIQGRTSTRIMSHLPEDHGVSKDSITRHYRNGHMPLQQSGIRALVEARAREVGRDIESHNEDLVDGVTLMRVMVQKGFERLASGTPVELAEALRAAKMLADLGDFDQGETDQAAYMEAFTIFHETARAVMDDEQSERFLKDLNDNPVLRAMIARHEGRDPNETESEADEHSQGSLTTAD